MAKHESSSHNAGKDDELLAAIRSVEIIQSVLHGKVRPLVSLVREVFQGYEGSEYELPEDAMDLICSELATVVTSQSLNHEYLKDRMTSHENIMKALSSSPIAEECIDNLSRIDLSRLRNYLDITMRIGILQFDRFANEIDVFPHMFRSGILIERFSISDTGKTPGILSDNVSPFIKNLYTIHKKTSDLYNAKYIGSSMGIGL
ncbi:hypothetical protein [Pseudomonas putida]|uniref:Uncharacterized protein n=1 Tax=Pseudomonas putida TaxID=303 RepID=A0A8I1EAI6_PSEPU|nr:hypothetical protein [Pseudomonas putida]MBI6882885.1 hypothetical protein [Pseudomonas putida]